jgi:protein TonB
LIFTIVYLLLHATEKKIEKPHHLHKILISVHNFKTNTNNILKTKSLTPKVEKKIQPIKQKKKHIKKKILKKKENKKIQHIKLPPKKRVVKIKKTVPKVEKKAQKKQKKVITELKKLKKNLPKTDIKETPKPTLPPISQAQHYKKNNLLAIQKMIAQNLYYPRKARRKRVTGDVLVDFTILKDGTIKDIKVIHSNAQILSRSAIKTLERISKKIPKPSQSLRIELPINYRLH